MFNSHQKPSRNGLLWDKDAPVLQWQQLPKEPESPILSLTPMVSDARSRQSCSCSLMLELVLMLLLLPMLVRVLAGVGLGVCALSWSTSNLAHIFPVRLLSCHQVPERILPPCIRFIFCSSSFASQSLSTPLVRVRKKPVQSQVHNSS